MPSWLAAEAPPVPAGKVNELCRAAQSYVSRALGVPMDLSEESLAFVDHYIDTIRAGEPLQDEALLLLASALGAHLGEVAIARFGGGWRLAMGPGVAPVVTVPDLHAADAPPNWRVVLAAAPLVFDPVGMAAEALRGGEVEGYSATMTTRPELAPLLTAALSRAAQVDEAYYYSLTGRLETLAYAVDILVELLHMPKIPADPADPADDDA